MMKRIILLILFVGVFCVNGYSQVFITPQYSREGFKMTSNIVFYDLDKRETLRTLPISVGSRDWWVNDDNVITGTCRTGIYNLNSINKYKADTLNVSGFIISATGAGDRVYLSKSYLENDIQYENWIEVWSFDKEAIVEKIELKKSYIVYDLKVSADNKFLALFRTNLEIGKSEFCIYNLSTDDIKVVNTFSEEFVNDIWGPSMIQWSNDTCYFSVINEVTEQQKYYTYSNGVTTPLFENNIADLNSSFTVFEGKLYKLKKNNYDFDELVYFNLSTEDTYKSCLHLEEEYSFGGIDLFYLIK